MEVEPAPPPAPPPAAQESSSQPQANGSSSQSRPPDGAQRHSSDKDREARKRHEAERERRRSGEKSGRPSDEHRTSSSSSQPGRTSSGSSSARPSDANDKSGSEFLCRLKFKNTLPELPFDPKFRAFPFDPMRFVRYATTSLERHYKHEIHVEPDLGIPIDLVDPSLYRAPVPTPLDPADAAILSADAPAAEAAAAGRKGKQRPNVSWLYRNVYMSNEGESSKRASRPSADKAVEVEAVVTRESQIQNIENTFNAAKQAPVHPTDRTLVPEVVVPIFPDLELWPNQYAHIVFDSDPVEEVAGKEEGGAVDREELSAGSFLKAFVDPEDPRRQKRFLAYMAPAERRRKAMRRADGSAPPAQPDEPAPDAREEELEWIREYDYRREDPRDNYLLVVRPDGAGGGPTAFYNQVKSKLILSRRKAFKTRAADGTPVAPAFSRPSRITAITRELNREDRKARSERLRELNEGGVANPEEEEEEEAEAEAEGAEAGEEGAGAAEARGDASSDDERQPRGSARQRRASDSDGEAAAGDASSGED
eukprot:tig00000615_g2583.t1